MINYSETLIDIITAAAVIIKKLPETELSTKPDPGKWSKKEILGHLADSAFNNYGRFIQSNIAYELVFPGYDQEEWVRLNDYQKRNRSEILALWLSLNLQIASLITKIPEKTLKNKTTNHNFDVVCMLEVSQGSESSLSYLIWDYLYHLEHHLGQIINGYKRKLGKFEE